MCNIIHRHNLWYPFKTPPRPLTQLQSQPFQSKRSLILCHTPRSFCNNHNHGNLLPRPTRTPRLSRIRKPIFTCHNIHLL
jgi:hypothetical protein